MKVTYEQSKNPWYRRYITHVITITTVDGLTEINLSPLFWLVVGLILIGVLA